MHSAWRSLPVVGLLVLGLVLGAAPAQARASCSCEIEHDLSSLDAAPTAFEGTVMSRSEDVWTVRVTSDPKGNLPEEVAVRAQEFNGDNCGVIWQLGRNIATLAELGEDGYLWTSGCGEISPKLLEQWAPPAGIQGRQPDLVAGGDWGAYRIVALSAGERVAFGYEPGRVTTLAVCPDERSMIEVALIGTPVRTGVGAGTVASAPGGLTAEVAVRSLENFALLRSAAVPLRLTDDLAATTESWSASCSRADGSEAFVTAGTGAGTHTWRVLTDADGTLSVLDAPADDAPEDDTPDVTSGLPDDWPRLAGLATVARTLVNPPAIVDPQPAPPAAVLVLNSTPPPAGWSPWLLVLVASALVLYVLRNIGKREWRNAWSRPSGSQNYDSRLDGHDKGGWFDRFRQ